MQPPLHHAEINELFVNVHYWHKVNHILKIWYKFSYTKTQANLFYFFSTKEFSDPSMLWFIQKIHKSYAFLMYIFSKTWHGLDGPDVHIH